MISWIANAATTEPSYAVTYDEILEKLAGMGLRKQEADDLTELVATVSTDPSSADSHLHIATTLVSLQECFRTDYFKNTAELAKTKAVSILEHCAAFDRVDVDATVLNAAKL